MMRIFERRNVLVVHNPFQQMAKFSFDCNLSFGFRKTIPSSAFEINSMAKFFLRKQLTDHLNSNQRQMYSHDLHDCNS